MDLFNKLKEMEILLSNRSEEMGPGKTRQIQVSALYRIPSGIAQERNRKNPAV